MAILLLVLLLNLLIILLLVGLIMVVVLMVVVFNFIIGIGMILMGEACLFGWTGAILLLKYSKKLLVAEPGIRNNQ